MFDHSCTIRFAIFSSGVGLFDPICDNQLLIDPQEEEGKPALNPIALIVLVVTDGHSDKTVTSPAHGTWIKGRDQLSKWLKAAIEHMNYASETSSAELIKTQNDRNNDFFDFDQDFKSAEELNNSRRGKWISNLPQFSILTTKFHIDNIDLLIVLKIQ